MFVALKWFSPYILQDCPPSEIFGLWPNTNREGMSIHSQHLHGGYRIQWQTVGPQKAPRWIRHWCRWVRHDAVLLPTAERTPQIQNWRTRYRRSYGGGDQDDSIRGAQSQNRVHQFPAWYQVLGWWELSKDAGIDVLLSGPFLAHHNVIYLDPKLQREIEKDGHPHLKIQKHFDFLVHGVPNRLTKSGTSSCIFQTPRCLG